MDFSKFDTTVASNTGKFLQLEIPDEHGNWRKAVTTPEDGSDPEPIGLMVKGPTSTEFKGREKALRSKRLEKVKVTRRGQIKGMGGSDDDQRELYAAMVTSFVKIPLDNQVLDGPAKLEEVLAFFDRFRWVEDQVVEFIDDDANWLGEG